MDETPGSRLNYAGFWVRLAAYALDVLFLSAIIGVIIFVIVLGVGFGALFGQDESALEPVTSVALVVAAVIGFLLLITYYVFFWTWGGQTPGKQIMGLKVVRADGSLLPWPWALLRLVGYLVGLLTLFAGYLVAAFDRRRQGLHDKMARSYVIKVYKGPG